MNKIIKAFLLILPLTFILRANVVLADSNLDNMASIVIESSSSKVNHLLEVEDLAGCDSILGDPNKDNPATPAYYLSFVFSIMRYAAIIILIVMTIMDFTGAVAAQDNDIMKKSISKLSKRFIMCIIIFFLPTLIDFILKFLHNSQISDCIDLSK